MTEQYKLKRAPSLIRWGLVLMTVPIVAFVIPLFWGSGEHDAYTSVVLYGLFVFGRVLGPLFLMPVGLVCLIVGSNRMARARRAKAKDPDAQA